jgi:hypothetical protein
VTSKKCVDFSQGHISNATGGKKRIRETVKGVRLVYFTTEKFTY